MHVCIDICIYIYSQINMSAYIVIYVWISKSCKYAQPIYIYVYRYIYTYVYIHTHIYI